MRTRRKRPWSTGDVYELKYFEGIHLECLLLFEPVAEFYRVNVQDGEKQKEELFTIMISTNIIKSCNWAHIESATLERAVSLGPKFVKYDRVTNKLEIYEDALSPARPAKWHECEGLELAAVHGEQHLISRLRESIFGEPYAWSAQRNIFK